MFYIHVNDSLPLFHPTFFCYPSSSSSSLFPDIYFCPSFITLTLHFTTLHSLLIVTHISLPFSSPYNSPFPSYLSLTPIPPSVHTSPFLTFSSSIFFYISFIPSSFNSSYSSSSSFSFIPILIFFLLSSFFSYFLSRISFYTFSYSSLL